MYTTSIYTISTAMGKGQVSKNTKLTIDWAGISEDQLKQIATSQIIIKVQSGFRKNGIPETFVISALSCVPGVRAAKVPDRQLSIEELFATMSDVEKQKFILDHM